MIDTSEPYLYTEDQMTCGCTLRVIPSLAHVCDEFSVKKSNKADWHSNFCAAIQGMQLDAAAKY